MKIILNRNELRGEAFFAFLLLISLAGKFSNLLGTVVGCIEVAVLIYFLFFKKIEDYTLMLLLILSISLEIPLYVNGADSTLYSFYNLPYVRGYHTYLFVLAPIIYMFKNQYLLNIFIGKIKRKYKSLAKFVYLLFLIQICGLIGMFLSILSNDNNCLNNPTYLMNVRRSILSVICVIAITCLTSYCLIMKSGFKERLIYFIEKLLIGVVISSFITIIFGLRGDYSNSSVLLLSQVSFYGAALLLFPFFSKKKKTFYLLSGLVIVVIMIKAASGVAGKWWLFVFAVAGEIILLNVKKLNKQKIKRILLGFLICIPLSIGLVAGVAKSVNNNVYTLAYNKFLNATSLLKFWTDNWYENMSTSPKFRIEEIANIGLEFIDKPEYLLIGKGFGGTIQHHWGDLDWDVIGSTFSETEVELGAYANVHDSFNILLLRYGLSGLLFFIIVAKNCIKNLLKNAYVLPGFIWFLFFYQGYTSLLMGVVFLVLGLYLAEEDKKLNYEN